MTAAGITVSGISIVGSGDTTPPTASTIDNLAQVWHLGAGYNDLLFAQFDLGALAFVNDDMTADEDAAMLAALSGHWSVPLS